MQRLGQALEQPRDADLVDHLGQLPATHVAHSPDHPRIAAQQRFGASIEGLLATDHHRQGAVDRACLAAGDRRVEKAQLTLGSQQRQLAGDFRRSGGVVDEQAARRHSGEGALLAQRHGTQVVVVTDATEHQLGASTGLARRIGAPSGVLLDPAQRLGRRAIVDTDVVALSLQVPGHRVAHRAQAEKCDRSHSVISSKSDPAA